jgi:hypothetical protein
MDANNVMLSLHIGLESQGVPQGNGQEKHVLFSGEQPEDTELWKALVSLWNTVLGMAYSSIY